MHDYKEYAPLEFDPDVFDLEKREQIFRNQQYTIPKESRKYKDYTRKLSKEDDKSQIDECFSELGEEFEYKPWAIGGILNHPDFQHIKIKIIYKNDIKINYKNKEEAIMDGYTNFSKDCMNSKGIIYPFTGLRGDSKQLWRQVKILKSESRIEFVKANTYPLQKKAIKNSDVVIWACGYESRPLPITFNNSLSGKIERLDFKRVGNNQLEVDDNLRLVNKGTLNNLSLYGIGLGYSIKTSNKHVKAEKTLNSRADGVRIYCSIVPFVLHKNICAKKATSKALKITVPDRAFSMQRSNIVYSDCKNKNRVSSVSKENRYEIEPIQEV